MTLHRPVCAFVALVTVAVCAHGCASKDQNTPPPVALRIGVGAPPKASRGSGFSNVVSAISTESWLTSLPNGRQSERIATAWSWNPAGTVLHLTLRKDVFFHDGTRLTPELAAQAFGVSMKDPNRASSFSSVKSFKANGDDGLDIELTEPNSFFLPDLSIVSLRMPGKPGVGTGPFRIVQADDQRASLQAFDKYYRGRHAIPSVEITNYPTQRSAWTGMMRGDIDMLYEVSQEALTFIKAEKSINTYTFPRPYFNAVVFNEGRAVLKNAAVRRALNEALDRATLIQEGMNGQGRPADGPLFPEHWAYSSPPTGFKFDPAAARSQLEAAGLKIRPGLNGRMPSRFSFSCLVFAEDPRFERLAVLVQKQLSEVGVDMRLEPLPLQAVTTRVQEGNFDAFLMELAGRSLGWVYEFWHSHDDGRMKNGYRSADAVLDRIRAARTDDEVRSGVAEMARILHDDPPAAFLAWQTTSRAVRNQFDMGQEANRDIISTIWNWRPAANEAVAR